MDEAVCALRGESCPGMAVVDHARSVDNWVIVRPFRRSALQPQARAQTAQGRTQGNGRVGGASSGGVTMNPR